MVDVKGAVRAALDYVNEFPELIPPRDVRLEETEYVDPGDWLITLSFLDNSITGLRSYKTFRIDGNSGAVTSMKRALLGTR
jgi:hypothetical protein